MTDNATSRVFAFDLQGDLIEWLDLSSVVDSGGLMGIDFDAQGRMYLVDAKANKVLRITAF